MEKPLDEFAKDASKSDGLRRVCMKCDNARRAKKRNGIEKCSVPDCGRPATYRGMCEAHYRRAMRHGDIGTLPIGGSRNFVGELYEAAIKYADAEFDDLPSAEVHLLKAARSYSDWMRR
jgi:hypothetical protein